MKTISLKPICFLFILLFPVSLIVSLNSATMTSDQKNFSVIFGLLFCMAGLIILSGGPEISRKKLMRVFWITVLILSVIFLSLLLMPCIELYWNYDMPFTTINDEHFLIYGFNIPNEKQLGVMLMIGLLMMLPARTLALSIMKLSQKDKH